MQRYAWLEQEGKAWHFLTNLSADPGESTRRWSDERHAILELMEEGWMVVRPYPRVPDLSDTGVSVNGYGLTRTLH
jgi:hypothetical protein